MSKQADIIKLHRLIYDTGRILEKVGKEIIFKPYGLTIPRFIILYTISQQPKQIIKMKDLQKQLKVSRANVTQRIDILERDELVKRRRGDNDREQVINLTNKGKKIIRKVQEKNIIALEKLYSGFKLKELKQGIYFLKKVSDSLKNIEM